MNAKNTVTLLLLCFAGVSVAYLVVDEFTSADAAAPVSTENGLATAASDVPRDAGSALSGAEQKIEHKVVVYYFHRTKRCSTCLTIESQAVAALKDGFAEAMESGALEWRLANLEEPVNEHFVTDFELTASALVLVDTWNGQQKKWTELYKVWELYDDEAEFTAYVKSEVAAYLGEGS